MISVFLLVADFEKMKADVAITLTQLLSVLLKTVTFRVFVSLMLFLMTAMPSSILS